MKAIIYDMVIDILSKNMQMIQIIVTSDRSEKEKAEILYSMVQSFKNDAKGRFHQDKVNRI